VPQKKMANSQLSHAGTPRWSFVETRATIAKIKMIGAETRPITIVLRAFLCDGPIVPGGIEIVNEVLRGPRCIDITESQ
jgi:hypothetical protein